MPGDEFIYIKGFDACFDEIVKRLRSGEAKK